MGNRPRFSKLQNIFFGTDHTNNWTCSNNITAIHHYLYEQSHSYVLLQFAFTPVTVMFWAGLIMSCSNPTILYDSHCRNLPTSHFIIESQIL